MNKVRNQRLASIITREVSEILQFEVKNSDIGFVTVTGANVTSDLSYAKIFISILGSKSDKQKTLDALERTKGFIRSQLAGRLNVRKCPELIFVEDNSLDYGNRIESIIDELNQK